MSISVCFRRLARAQREVPGKERCVLGRLPTSLPGTRLPCVTRPSDRHPLPAKLGRNARRISRRAPDQPLPMPWRDLSRRKRIETLKPRERRPNRRDGKKCRQRAAGQFRYTLKRCCKVITCELSQVRERCIDARGSAARKQILSPHVVALQ